MNLKLYKTRQPFLYPASWLVLAMLSLSTGMAQAQVFKWVSPDGKVNYGDRPAAPPPRAENKTVTGNVVGNDTLPFTLAEATKNAPVTLYTGQKCTACEDGRKLLSLRGIPFSEKTVVTNADIVSFGGTEVELPQLAIGTRRLSGFDAAAWQARLTAVGYPESNTLPKAYRNPPPISAAPTKPLDSSNPLNPLAKSDANDTRAEQRTQLHNRQSGNTAPAKPAPTKPSESTLPGLRF